ncbi:MAG TPA: TRAM domain-containing protein, partial [Candidatus Polarisedimenticolia bacterium]|nr:TRAM domain-containing protein [Candidatus Polarisedimenticolia bacterium]
MTSSTEAPGPGDRPDSTPPRRGDLLDLAITDLARAGRGVARHGGLVLFVEGALPGERVRARVTGIRKAFGEARTQSILSASSERVVPPCRHFGTCGGCDLQHLAVGAQAEAKRRQLEAALARIGGLQGTRVDPTVPAPAPYGYRFRMDFDWRPGPAHPILGLHRRHSADVIVPLEECRLAGPVTAE